MVNVGDLSCQALYLLSPFWELTLSFRYPPHQLMTASKHGGLSPATVAVQSPLYQKLGCN